METPMNTQIGGDHYRSMRIQPERFIFENGIGFHEGSAIKYLCRWRKKGGVQDLEKAKHFIDLLIENEKRAEVEAATPPLPLVSSSMLTPPPGWRRMEGHERIDTVSRLFSEHGYASPATSRLGKKVSEVCGLYITPDWHNPRKLESPGEGYRFLLTSEARQDATHYWDSSTLTWDPIVGKNNDPLLPEDTYCTNKPLPCPPHNTTS